MEENLIKWGGYIGMLATTGLYFFFPARRKELDEATSKLVKTLQETVGALERDLNIYKERTLKLEEHQRENIAKIASLDSQRQLLQDFIDGRDKATTKFQEESIRIIIETNNTVRLMMDGLVKNNQMTEEFVKTMREHFLNLEKEAIKK